MGLVEEGAGESALPKHLPCGTPCTLCPWDLVAAGRFESACGASPRCEVLLLGSTGVEQQGRACQMRVHQGEGRPGGVLPY